MTNRNAGVNACVNDGWIEASLIPGTEVHHEPPPRNQHPRQHPHPAQRPRGLGGAGPAQAGLCVIFASSRSRRIAAVWSGNGSARPALMAAWLRRKKWPLRHSSSCRENVRSVQ
jgi:hypothetical protein